MLEALERGWHNLIGRADERMWFRLILQPAVAIFFAVRAGLRDARRGQPPFLWAVLTTPGRRRELLLQGWGDVGKVFFIALLLDAVYQVIVHSAVYTLELLLTATVLALVPYAVLRGLVTRVARRPSAAARADEAPASDPIQAERPIKNERTP